MGSMNIRNEAAPGVPYFTPAQVPAPGTALTESASSPVPTLFTPLRMRSVELHNRFVVAPMCMYSAQDGHVTDFHLVHLGQLALHGAGLVFVEATAVELRGRISPEDSGLWKDSQIEPLRRVVDFIHSQGSKAAIQLAHSGRKGSTIAPWITSATSKTLADESVGGFAAELGGPSAIPFSSEHGNPKEFSVEDIESIVKNFVASAERAVKAGFDVIEIHSAHGYLIHEFLSPLSNKRTDKYGGSFENRIRFLQEVSQAVRAVVPSHLPLWVRVSATDWMEWASEPSWTVEETIQLAKLLPSWGIDLLDVSSAGNHEHQKIPNIKSYQTEIAGKIRRALRADGVDLLVSAVGFITDTETANDAVQEGPGAVADLVLAGRQFLREPEWVLRVAHELKVPVKWANQYSRAGPRLEFDKKF